MSEIKRMDIKEFQREGFLQEVNRQFFHPLGLALEIIVNTDTDEVKLGGVWDFRDNPEGMCFADGTIDPWEVDTVKKLFYEKAKIRQEKFGWVIQPAPNNSL